MEVDALGRVVREAGAREEVAAESAAPLYTNIDLPLQRFMAGIFGDSLQGGAIAIDPKTGGVLAMYSAPSYDPNRFVGGIPPELWKSLNADPRRPLFNKVTQGRYPPGSTWKLATAAVALERGLVKLDDRMPVACTGGYQFGNRYFHCWEPKGHGNLTLAEAIEKSCDVYFYQLGLKVGLSSLVAGGIKLGARDKTAIDLPDEARPTFPYDDVTNYYNRKYGKNGWSQAVILNLSIGQGENAQTVVSMARFYTALATDGSAAKPEVVRDKPERTQILQLSRGTAVGIARGARGRDLERNRGKCAHRGRRARGQDGHGAELRGSAASPCVVRRVRSGRRSEDRRRGDAGVRRTRNARRAHRVQDHPVVSARRADQLHQHRRLMRRVVADYPLILAALLLSGYGVAMVYSAGQTDVPTVATFAWIAQIRWVILSVFLAYSGQSRLGALRRVGCASGLHRHLPALARAAQVRRRRR